MSGASPTITPSARALRPGGFVSPSWRWVAIGALIVVAVPTALVAVAEGSGALRLPFDLFVIDARLPLLFRLHMLASGLSLLLIPTTIAMRRDRIWHRPLGRLASTCVVTGALTSLPVAIVSSSAPLARAGFFAQGTVWITLLALGIAAIRRRDVPRHQRFMLAMAAVATGAIWVRLTTAFAVTGQLPFDPVYSAIAWLGWLVPLSMVWHWAPRFGFR